QISTRGKPQCRPKSHYRLASAERQAEMTCPKCQYENTKRFGVYGRKRIQRFRCKSCGTTFSEDRPKPLGNHYVDFNEAIGVLSLLLEGMSKIGRASCRERDDNVVLELWLLMKKYMNI